MNIVLVIPPGRLDAVERARSSPLRGLIAIYLRLGHRVLVVTADSLEFADDLLTEKSTAYETVNLPTLTDFRGSELFRIGPLSREAKQTLTAFQPDVVHSFSSFLLGATAVRIAAEYGIPLVYSYAHWRDEYPDLPDQSERLRRFMRKYAITFSNLADLILVPGPSLIHELQISGITTPIDVVPRGVELSRLGARDRESARIKLGIQGDAFMIGIPVLATEYQHTQRFIRSIVALLKRHHQVQLLVSGAPIQREAFCSHFDKTVYRERIRISESSTRDDPAEVYSALGCLLLSEAGELTNLMAIESLAAGVPVLAPTDSEAGALIREGENGFVFANSSQRSLTETLEKAVTALPAAREQMAQHARLSVNHLTLEAWAEKTLNCYANVSEWKPTGKQKQESDWEHARTVLDTEWQLWTQRFKAAGAYLSDGRHPSRVPFLRHVFFWWRRLRRWLSRREWSVKLLDLPIYQQTADEPGLILVQIDGLARPELERAITDGRMPFLSRLIKREHYTIETMYSGLPSTTPAVLGELFYGVRQAVPAFGFRDHRSGEVVQMFQPLTAATIQDELSQKGAALLEGGSVYCDIYSGGAANSSFCPATTGWHYIEDVTVWRRAILFFLNIMSLARIGALALVELVVGIGDGIRGIYRGIEIFEELTYIPRRLMVNIVLREFVAISAEIDATRGVPVMHINLLGYDENAHRRGPDAKFAHYALGGIDHVIKRIWDAAHASQRRDYHVWIMADHGQQHSIPYANEMKETVGDAVNRIYRSEMHQPAPEQRKYSRKNDAGIETLRAAWLRSKPKQPQENKKSRPEESEPKLPTTVAIGPLGYIYWPDPLTSEEKKRLAQRFVEEAAVPIVIVADGEETWAWTKQGRYQLPDDASKILAPDHPHLEEVSKDLLTLCRHVDAGDFVISGWRNDKLPISFVKENGAHAGPGPNETSGFVMLPADVPLKPNASGTFRPLHLRQSAQRVLGRETSRLKNGEQRETNNHICLVTYNVHSCIGLDGRLSPARIARVLAATKPDIVALQELDVKRLRSGFADQVAEIARVIEMEFQFHSNVSVAGEQYGSAILSRFPLRIIRSGGLPTPAHREPRGVLWVEVNVGDELVQVMTTHLGLSTEEREAQVDALLSSQWMGHKDCQSPLILCGDFNFMPGSRPYKKIANVMHDVQTGLEGHRPRRTWFSPLPLTRIDHVFISPRLRTLRIDVPRTRLARIASDHLPLVVDLEILPAPRQSDAEMELSALHT
jgi:endonuclease/exonuclease/phosphatase family metal-dependent hydrolase/glycosyltransferase involved in cell wall biosynthesis